MNQLSLKELNFFVHWNLDDDQTTSELRMALAPSGNLLAHYNTKSVLIFNITSKEMILNFTANAKSLIFGVDDYDIYISDGFSLQKIDIKNGKSIMIIEPDKNYNKITSLTYSPDQKVIYFINQSHLASYSPGLLKLSLTVLNNSALCPIDQFFVDSASQILVSSSYDCKLCSYMISNQGLQFQYRSSIDHCRMGGMTFVNNYAYVTQDSIISKYPQIILLNFPQLSVVSYINQSSTNFSLQLLNLRNYLSSFGKGDDFVWIYQSSLNSKPSKVALSQNVFEMIFNKHTNEAYLLLVNDSNSSISIKSFGLAFNCSSIKDTVNATLQFEQQCKCKNGKLFDSSSQSCKQIDCKNTKDSPCKCPYQQVFDQFSLQCSLDCSSIYNTYNSISFGTPNRCSCNYPFEWNPLVGDCSQIDCSLIENTVNRNISQSCICKQSYFWDDSTLRCKSNSSNSILSWDSSSSVPAGLIVAIVFIVLAVILSAVIFYVKKYRKSEEDQPKEYEYPKKYEEHNPTPRPLSSENFMRTSQELKVQE